ncbi:MAG: galactose-1-phosphate uridylyltransferase [Deltaproteobacteria bacterium]|nr:galactose-1-phosphate uridylyltransferase [Deltaproteobacteria bacterium]MBW2305480.1 galactose-1-phosphate uridylyltransferase [Deltaproteobacteria bacterium]
MPEFRQNFATKEWVIIATERARRPDTFRHSQRERKNPPPFDPQCPFCPGNEDKTPAAVFQINDDGGWALRAVPNKYAALAEDLGTQRTHEGLFLRAGGYGIAEVIIETPAHDQNPATMGRESIRNVVLAYRNRYTDISLHEKVELITVFRNHGSRAGTSLEHPHSQVIATPITPPHVRDQIYQARISYDTFGSCIYCDMLAEEIRQQERIIMENDNFVAYCPFASRSPFEARIIPKLHRGSFGNINDEEVNAFSHILQEVLKKIYTGLGDPDYNFIIRSAPVQDSNVKHYHWYTVIVPRLTTPAGFEMGTGIYINVSYPEQCARFLRELST